MIRTAEIIIAIKPKYADSIFNGRKTIEYRRRVPKRLSRMRMYVYSSTPVKRVIGYAEVEVRQGDVFNIDGTEGLLSREEYETYFNGSKDRYGLVIKETHLFKKERTLDEFDIKSPPQSWMYLKK